jgi:hypothetical protein
MYHALFLWALDECQVCFRVKQGAMSRRLEESHFIWYQFVAAGSFDLEGMGTLSACEGIFIAAV